MWGRRITEADLDRVRREATTDATLSTQMMAFQAAFNAHCITCESDKLKRDEQHEANQKAIAKLNGYIWLATGAWGALMLGLKLVDMLGFHH